MKLLDDDGNDLLHPLTNGQRWYRDVFLKSDKWKALTAENKRKNKLCVICGESSSTESHHLTYANIKLFKIGDLLAVCHKCHMAIHVEEEIKRQLAVRKTRG